jgi:hypothetical protein
MRATAFLLAFASTSCATAQVEAPAPAPPPPATIAAAPPAKPARPDFTGVWGYNSRGVVADAQGNAFTNFPARDRSLVNFETDFAVLERSDENMPLYKPEYWELIRQKDYYGIGEEPTFSCLPAGVPRMGPPQRIVQDGETLVFLYVGAADTFRIIPTDGRELTKEQLGDITWKGYSTAKWEGDRLVITSKAFNDASWLGWAGWVHSIDMVVTETMWREGDNLHWIAKVEDPMFLEPWTTEPIVRARTTDPNVFFWESPPCEEHDLEHIVDQQVRG